jgi:hypothetical protein
VRADAVAEIVRLRDVVGADRDEAAIGDVQLAMELDESLVMPTILGTIREQLFRARVEPQRPRRALGRGDIGLLLGDVRAVTTRRAHGSAFSDASALRGAETEVTESFRTAHGMQQGIIVWAPEGRPTRYEG